MRLEPRLSVSAGGGHSAVIFEDGTLWTWGSNTFGQIGDGTGGGGWSGGSPDRSGNRSAPVRIGDGANWARVSAGSVHTVAIKTDGSLWAWGWNGGGQLGDGTTEDRVAPVWVGADYDWAYVAVGGGYAVAIKEDGTLWAWGDNRHGQLGDGTTIDRMTPAQIGARSDWVSVSAGDFHTVAARADGSIWIWGVLDGEGTAQDEFIVHSQSLVPVRVMGGSYE